MIRAIVTLFLSCFLASCGNLMHVTKLEIQQGNIIKPAMVNRLHNGMSQEQVRAVMGNPVLINIFTPGRIEYVYTYQVGKNPRVEQHVTCLFENGRLVEVKKSI